MRVRIIGCSKNTYWYSGKIGEEFEVSDIQKHSDRYLVDTVDKEVGYTIDKIDCEEIKVKTSDELKIVQISADSSRGFYALCADGSIWYREGCKWVELSRPVRS